MKTKKVEIRPAEDSDAQAIIDLIGVIYEEYPGCILDVEGDEPQLLRPASHYSGKGGCFWVAELSEQEAAEPRIVGTIASLEVEAGQQLYNFYLSRDARGSGLAKDLFAKVLEHSAGRKARSIVLWTDTRFTRAHSFYERLGFAKGPMVRSLADKSWSVEFFYRLELARLPGGPGA